MLTIGEFGAYWIFTGVLGVLLAGRLLLLAAEDRGTLRLSGLNGPYRLINRKMMRESMLRLMVSLFSVFVGLVIFIAPHPLPRPSLTATGLSLCLGFSFVKTGNAIVSVLDMRDRDRLIVQEGGFHANLGSTASG